MCGFVIFDIKNTAGDYILRKVYIYFIVVLRGSISGAYERRRFYIAQVWRGNGIKYLHGSRIYDIHPPVLAVKTAYV